ncbi:MAG: outer membrane protein transport protein [Deltaproteobacteria bacterium]|nr:outer membrane protein transport protein [Deltaproteobacteria bacterium]
MCSDCGRSKLAWGGAIFVLGVVLLFSKPGVGGGLEFPGIGTTAGARGGAFAAKADTPEAFLYNPAGLSKALKRELLVSFQLVHVHLGYDRSGSGGYWLDSPGQNSAEICQDGQICIADPALDFSAGAPGEPFDAVDMSKVGPLPVLVFNWGNVGGVNGLALSAGLAPPSGFAAFSLPEDGPQRYSLIESGHFMIFPGVGISYRFNRYVQIGGVFYSGVAHLSQSLKIRPLPSMASTSFNENLGGDALLQISAVDPFVPTGLFGILVSPAKWLETGVSVKLPAYIRADGTMEYEPPENDMVNSYMASGNDKLLLKQHFPTKVTFGVRGIGSRFDVELDAVFENWASVKGFDILPDAVITDPIDENTVSDTPMPDSQVPKHYRNTVSVHLGSSIDVLPGKLTVHLGTFYQSSAYPKDNRTFNVDVPFATQIGATGGVSWNVAGWLTLHASYAHIFQPEVVVSEGVVQQQGLPLSTGENIGNTINNGTYNVALNIFGFASEFHF